MKLNYKKLGNYISLVDERNKELKITNLQGVSINKEFIPSIANIIGTDLSSYKIVRKGQFAYGPVTSRNGDKISIALLKEDNCIISSSYTSFEVTSKELMPEYLMLWFRRPEFDRYARFMSNGSAREVFDWDNICNVMLPVPSLQEQEKIVNNYKVIEDRIELLKKMKNKYYDLVNLIYSNIKTNNLVSMIEFPNLKEINSSISKFTGLKKYIATGNIDFDEVLNDCVNVDYDNRPSRANMEPRSKSIWFAKMQNTDKYLFFDDLSFEDNLIILSTGFMGIQCNSDLIYYLNSFVLTKEFVNQKNKFATGTTQIAINSSALNQIKVPLPKESIDKELKTLKCLFLNIKNLNKEIDLLLLFKNCMLSNLTKEE